MKIHLANATQIRLLFAYNKRIIEQVKTIAGRAYDENTRTWLAPITQLRRCEELFPYAEFAPAVWSAEAEIMRASAEQLLTALQRNGATFTLQDGIVHATGACVSPLTADIVRERSVYFAALLQAEKLHPINRINQREDT